MHCSSSCQLACSSKQLKPDSNSMMRSGNLFSRKLSKLHRSNKEIFKAVEKSWKERKKRKKKERKYKLQNSSLLLCCCWSLSSMLAQFSRNRLVFNIFFFVLHSSPAAMWLAGKRKLSCVAFACRRTLDFALLSARSLTIVVSVVCSVLCVHSWIRRAILLEMKIRVFFSTHHHRRADEERSAHDITYLHHGPGSNTPPCSSLFRWESGAVVLTS